jgi:hypothetical protein
MTSMPKAVVCYICGRQYGTSSIAIHQKTCLKQFEAQEAEKPAHLRRALPDPSSFTASFSSLAAQNDAASQMFNQQMLSKCEFCGRTFLPEKLVVHQRSCRPGNTAKPIGAPTLGGAGAPNHPIRKAGRVRRCTVVCIVRFFICIRSDGLRGMLAWVDSDCNAVRPLVVCRSLCAFSPPPCPLPAGFVITGDLPSHRAASATSPCH